MTVNGEQRKIETSGSLSSRKENSSFEEVDATALPFDIIVIVVKYAV